MKMIVFISFFLCGSIEMSLLYAQRNQSFMEAYSHSIGHISSVIPGIMNPAFTSFTTSRAVELNYLNRFGLKELSTFSAAFYCPNPWLNGALYLSRYGFSEYNETRISMNLSRRLAEKWALGVRINYDRMHYSAVYSDQHVVTADVGVWIEPVKDKLNLAFVVCNPLQRAVTPEGDEEEEPFPVVFLWGASYRLHSQFLLLGEFEKREDASLQCKLGVEYQPFSVFSLRAGVQSTPFSPCFGVGWQHKSFHLHIGFSHYAQLGFQSACGLQFSF